MRVANEQQSRYLITDFSSWSEHPTRDHKSLGLRKNLSIWRQPPGSDQKSQTVQDKSRAFTCSAQSLQRVVTCFVCGSCSYGVLQGTRIHSSHRVGIHSPAGSAPGRTSVACLIFMPIPTIQNASGPICGKLVLFRSKNLRSFDRMNLTLKTFSLAQQAVTRRDRAGESFLG